MILMDGGDEGKRRVVSLDCYDSSSSSDRLRLLTVDANSTRSSMRESFGEPEGEEEDLHRLSHIDGIRMFDSILMDTTRRSDSNDHDTADHSSEIPVVTTPLRSSISNYPLVDRMVNHPLTADNTATTEEKKKAMLHNVMHPLDTLFNIVELQSTVSRSRSASLSRNPSRHSSDSSSAFDMSQVFVDDLKETERQNRSNCVNLRASIEHADVPLPHNDHSPLHDDFDSPRSTISVNHANVAQSRASSISSYSSSPVISQGSPRTVEPEHEQEYFLGPSTTPLLFLGWRNRYPFFRPLVTQFCYVGVQYFRPFVTGSVDRDFYEAVRLQPYTSGTYLRAIIMSGAFTFFSHFYSLVVWEFLPRNSPECGEFNFFSSTVLVQYLVSLLLPGGDVRGICGDFAYDDAVYWAEDFLFLWLCLLVFLNMLQLPLRVYIHNQCFESSRSYELVDAMNILRLLMAGDMWLMNRALGWCSHCLSLVGLCVCEMYLWRDWSTNGSGRGFQSSSVAQHTTHPLAAQINSIASTILFSMFMRISASLIFAISMQQPTVLQDVRQRGLSDYDYNLLPTFTFRLTNEKRENKNREGEEKCISDDSKNVDSEDWKCPICLDQFEEGDSLTLLPCDRRHCFHSKCIKEWLLRQNSCPLCLRHV